MGRKIKILIVDMDTSEVLAEIDNVDEYNLSKPLARSELVDQIKLEIDVAMGR